MTITRRGALILVVAGLTGVTAQGVLAQARKLDTQRIEEITGLKGALTEQEGAFKVTSPRADTKVSVDGWSMPPFMGLTSWASFQAGQGDKAMVMGDLVLFQDEVNPVLSELLDSGLEVTALHNHFFFDDPKVYFMHIGGEAPLEQLAKGVRRALDRVKETRAKSPVPPSGFGGPPMPQTSAITGKTVEDGLGAKGQANNGMFKVVIGRTAKAPCGCEIGKEMGVNTWAAFAGTDDNAVVDGDFAMLESELQEVLKALRKADINIVAIHHHMAGETPRYLFLHYWGRGRVDALTRGLKAALGTQSASTQTAAAPLVVFVCEHGSAKSLAAASLFDRMARERGLAVRAISRGTAPDSAVPPPVVALLKDDGFDVASFRPQALAESDVAAAARVVAIGVDVGETGARAGERLERWDDIPPFSQGYPEARKALVSHIDALLRDLKPKAREDR